MEPHVFDIGWKPIGKILAAIFLVWIVYMVRDSIAAFLLAIVISIIFDPIVSCLQRRSIPRVLSTIGIFVLALLLVSVVLYIVFPLAVSEVKGLIITLSSANNDFLNLVRLKSSEFTQTIDSALNQFINSFLTGNVSLLDLTGKFFGGIFLTVTTLAIAFYLTIGKDGVENFLCAISPRADKAIVIAVYQRVKKKISRWFLGQLMLSAYAGIVVFTGLKILGVPYSLTLGILAMIFELVPFVGPIFIGALSIVVALNISTALALYTFVFFVVIQQVETHAIVPFVHRFTTGLSPVVIVVSIIIGARLAGAIGVLLGIPIAILVTELITERAVARSAG